MSYLTEYSLIQLMKLPLLNCLAILFTATQLQAQILDNNFLNGRYGFRQVLISTTPAGQPIEGRSLIGILSFDGRGSFSFQGTRNNGNNAPAPFSGSGSYSVSASGLVSMTNPLDLNTQLNARLGAGLLLGSTTDSAGNLFDLFAAAPLPSQPTSNATVTGAYAGVSIEFPNGLFNNIKNSFFRFTANGAGSLGLVNTSGQTVQNGRRVLQQQIGPSSYSLGADGAGLLIFPVTAPFAANTQLLLGDKQLYTASNGEFLIGGSTSQGAHDFFFAMRAAAGVSSMASFQGLYFAAGLRIDQSRPSSFAGAINGLGNGRAVWSRRSRLPEGNADLTAVNDYTVGPDGVGSILNNRFVLGLNNTAFVGAGVSFADSDNYELFLGIRSRDLSGTGIFINPAGVLNGASFAPVGNPIAPGQFIALFGSGLGPATPLVAAAPFPASLGDISLTIQGRPAPLFFVSANQISALVPFATSGTSADIVIRQGGQESNRVTVPVARSAPGIYSNTQNGIGPGAILRSDFSLLTTANPTRRGETVLIYLTGLGPLDPPLADGVAAPTTTLSRVADTVNVYIGGQRATVSFAGAAPGFAGLYQLNVVIPNNAPIGSAVPVAVETLQAFHEMVDIAIQP